MVAQRLAGLTLEEVALQYGVSRERIRQLTPEVKGGRASAARRAMRDEQIAMDRADVLHAIRERLVPLDKIREQFGLTRAEFRRIAHSDELSLRISHSRGISAGQKHEATDEQALGGLRAAARIAGRTPGSALYNRLRKQGRLPADAISAAGLTVKYGGWSGACIQAGLEPNKRPEHLGLPRWSEDEFLDMLIRWRREKGEWPTIEAWDAEIKSPTAGTIRSRFGAWLGVLELAQARMRERDNG